LPHEKCPKVLFIATVYTHLANFHIPFIKLLKNKGYEVHAAASSTEGRMDEIEAVGIHCHDILFSRSPFSPSNIKAFMQLVSIFRLHHFELIHVHTPIAAFLARLAAKATKQGAVLYTAHGFHFFKGAPLIDWLFYFSAEKIAAKLTDCLITINGEDYKNAQRLGFKPGKSLYLVNGVGVDVEKYDLPTVTGNIRKELNISKDAVIVSCIAELSAVKDHAFLLNAWGRIAKRSEDVHLLLVGTGRDEQKLKLKVQDERIPRVRFLGFRHDVKDILDGTDIVVLTSKREGLPKSIMEAMAAGKPVIATDVRGSRDLVQNERTGLLVESGNLDGLVKAMDRLILDGQLRLSFGSAGRDKIMDYSLQNVLTQMSAIYDMISKS
jgi:glycosyltransferase involved in cell wall biosynthesis